MPGIFMKPLDWKSALLVWGYALVGFLIENRIKLAAYRIFHPDAPALLAKTRMSAT